MRWQKSWRADPLARVIADRHYNRQKVGAPQFVPPGRCVVLRTPEADALWVTSWPFAEYTKHAWPGAWMCSAFRNESQHLSSELITEAVQATRYLFGAPPALGFITFVDTTKVRQKRNPGWCYLKAGWTKLPETTGKGLLVFQQKPEDMPPARATVDMLDLSTLDLDLAQSIG